MTLTVKMMRGILHSVRCLFTPPPGKEHNFNTYDDTKSSALNVPYDYGSMMHYSKTAFNKGSAPTIVTKIPEFMDVIGQRMEFSDSDLLKLNRLYNCSRSLAGSVLDQTRVRQLACELL